jgi:UDP-N-acetylglucosamine 2-epimerase
MPLMKAVQKDDNFQLQLLVTGMHLSPEFGLTYQQIERDGFAIDEKVEIPQKLQEFMKGEKKSLPLTKDFETFKSYLMTI